MELGYDGNAATVMPTASPAPERPSAAGAEGTRIKVIKRRSRNFWKGAKSAAAAVPATVSAPRAVIGILVVAAVIIAMLISHAQLVMINDQAVNLRSELSQLQSEESKLKAQYELTYDLQEIENQMLTSGQMIKIQSWQTYMLELSEPDAVEYFQYKGSLNERVANTAKNIISAVQEYF